MNRKKSLKLLAGLFGTALITAAIIVFSEKETDRRATSADHRETASSAREIVARDRGDDLQEKSAAPGGNVTSVRGRRFSVGDILEIEPEALALLPPFKVEHAAVYLKDSSSAPRSLLDQGKLITGNHLLLPLTVVEEHLSSLKSAGTVLPVFGEGAETMFLTEKIVVRFRENRSQEALDDFAEEIGALSRRALFGPVNLYTFTLPRESIAEMPMLSWQIARRPEVLYAEPNWLIVTKSSSVDPLFSKQWALENTGQSLDDPVPGIVPDSDIDAPEAWQITTGNGNVIVAVVDDGVDYTHPDLAASMVAPALWYDTVDDDADPLPSGNDAHGTAIAGIIAATMDNGLGIRGIAPGCKIMPIRIAFGSNGDMIAESADKADAIGWAWQNGASVINLSWGTGSVPTVLRDALDAALTSGRAGKGCVVVAAAGNDNGPVRDFPANVPEVLTVGASSPADERKSPTSVDGETQWGSSFGSPLDCVAPGVKITTTDRPGVAGYTATDYTPRFNGTSAAAPHASGIAALVLSVDEDLTKGEVISILGKSADRVGVYEYRELKEFGVWDEEMGYGRLNAFRSVSMAQGVDYESPRITHSPTPDQNFTGPFTLTATITDNTGIESSPAAPVLYYSVDDGAWIAVTDADGPVGDLYAFTIPFAAMGSDVRYYFAAQDESPQKNMASLPWGAEGVSPPGSTPPARYFSFAVDIDAGATTVNDDGPADFSSIQEAIDASNFGDTIKVAAGTYHENLSVNAKDGITIRGGYSEDFEDHSYQEYPSIIDGGNVATVASFFNCDDTTFEGFTLINGEGSFLFGVARWAGGFIVKDGSGMKLSQLKISGCSAYAGGGGVIFGADDFVLGHTRFSQNESISGGSALYIRGCEPSISYILADNNYSPRDGRAIQYYFGAGTITNATVVDNIAFEDYANSAGIYWSGAFPGGVKPSLVNSIVKYNYKSDGAEEDNINTFHFQTITSSLLSKNSGAPDPKFLNRALGYYNLLEGSPAINAAVDQGFDFDLEGQAVPYAAAPDIGALEHFTSDFDNDQMPDVWEVANGLQPGIADGSDDNDDDGIDNYSEYVAGTLPSDSSSFFSVKNIANTSNPGEFLIEWQGVAGRLYTIYSTTTLDPPDWQATSHFDIPGVNAPMSRVLSVPSIDRCFFKVSVKLDQ